MLLLILLHCQSSLGNIFNIYIYIVVMEWVEFRMTNSAQYIPRYRAIYHLFENELDKHLKVIFDYSFAHLWAHQEERAEYY